MNRSIAVLPLVFLLVTSGCGKPADIRTAPVGSGPPVAVETARAAATEVEQAVEIVGTLAARSEADVKTEYSGTVAEISSRSGSA